MGSGFVLIFLLVIIFNVIRNLIHGKKRHVDETWSPTANEQENIENIEERESTTINGEK